MKPTSTRFLPVADAALDSAQLQRALTTATGRFTAGRLAAGAELANWQSLRNQGRAIREEAIHRLDELLLLLEQNVRAQGGEVFWARDGVEACTYITDLAHRRGVTLAVKSKSMTTEEIALNDALDRAGVTPIETDLGEYILQLAGDTPSHFLAPAVHWNRDQVAQLFVDKLGIPWTQDVGTLTRAARAALRRRFLEAGMGITGANFGVAETGTIVVVENEGNVRLTTSAPAIHVAVMGLEKVIPRFEDLEVLLTLLPRSATGQRMSSYVSLLNGRRRPGEPDGPTEFHLVLLDNGRSRILADPEGRESLYCIRCAACLAVCPVYRRVGGHAYGWVYQGPIGAVLTPQYLGPEAGAPLPFASSLCGACRDACPVKIDLPRLLLHQRERVVEDVVKRHSGFGALGARIAGWFLQTPARFAFAGALVRTFLHLTGTGRWLRNVPGPLRGWIASRDLPKPPARPLRDLVGK